MSEERGERERGRRKEGFQPINKFYPESVEGQPINPV
jgi:hypothetical protein